MKTGTIGAKKQLPTPTILPASVLYQLLSLFAISRDLFPNFFALESETSSYFLICWLTPRRPSFTPAEKQNNIFNLIVKLATQKFFRVIFVFPWQKATFLKTSDEKQENSVAATF